MTFAELHKLGRMLVIIPLQWYPQVPWHSPSAIHNESDLPQLSLILRLFRMLEISIGDVGACAACQAWKSVTGNGLSIFVALVIEHHEYGHAAKHIQKTVLRS